MIQQIIIIMLSADSVQALLRVFHHIILNSVTTFQGKGKWRHIDVNQDTHQVYVTPKLHSHLT